MRAFKETRLALGAVLMAVAAAAAAAAAATTTPTAAAAGTSSQLAQRVHRHVFCGFVGPAIAQSSAATRSTDTTPGPKKSGVLRAPATQRATPESPIARRMQLRRARARPRLRTGSGTTTDAPPRQQQEETEGKGSGGDVGNLFRMEVAQRLKEMKIMTQPGVGPLAAAGGVAGAGALVATARLDGDATGLEAQIALLTNRIKSIANHLQSTPTDAVSRKGLVVLVKRRRALLETLRHRDNESWLATTESLGLRQRPDAAAGGVTAAAAAAAEQSMLAARRARRRDRGRRRRREEEEGEQGGQAR